MTLWNALSSKKSTLVFGKILSSQIVSSIVLKFKQLEAKNRRSSFLGFQSGRVGRIVLWFNRICLITPEKTTNQKQQIRLLYCRHLGLVLTDLEWGKGRKAENQMDIFRFCFSISTAMNFQNMNYNKIQEPLQIQ